MAEKSFKSTDEAYKWLVNEAKRLGFTQRDIASKLGQTPQQITNSLRRGNVKIQAVVKLAALLKTKITLTLK